MKSSKTRRGEWKTTLQRRKNILETLRVTAGRAGAALSGKEHKEPQRHGSFLLENDDICDQPPHCRVLPSIQEKQMDTVLGEPSSTCSSAQALASVTGF